MNTIPTHKKDNDIPQNSNVDEYLRREGMTDEEWKRVFDLRYCTILVPFEDSDNEVEEEEEEEDSDQEELELEKTTKHTNNKGMSTPPRRQRQTQSLTPKGSEGQHSYSKTSTRREPNSSAPNIGLQTPPVKQPKSFEPPNISNNQEDDEIDIDTTRLTIDDPLASFLPTSSKISFQTKSLTPGYTSNFKMEDTNDDSMEISPFTSHDEQTTHNESLRAGIKRRHWELEPTHRLLQSTQPDSSKRVALTTSIVGTSSASSMGLLKPRSFSPNPSSTLLQTQRRSSVSSDISSVNHDFTQSKLWTKQNWKALETIYNNMDGSSMAEEDLVQIANRFLTEQETLTGEAPIWTREKILMRCIALYRVRNDTHPGSLDNNKNSSTLAHRSTSVFSSLRNASRGSTQPYPSRKLMNPSNRDNNISSRDDSTSSSAISDFLSSQRAERSNKQRNTEQAYQLKSVFKHRLASGLRTVGQLIPFWKDVEQGNTDIKGKEKVPLGVPLGVAKSVIDTFENKSIGGSESGGSVYSRSGSVSSSSDTSNEIAEKSSSSSSFPTSPASSIADMLARGHSVRSARSASVTSESLIA